MANSRYARLLTHYPIPVIVVVLVIVTSCTLVNLFCGKPPDFNNPIEGFKPRRTIIHSSYSTWLNLLEETAVGSEPHKSLTMYHRLDKQDKKSNVNYQRDRRDITVYNHAKSDDGYGINDKQEFFCDSTPRSGHAKLVFAVEGLDFLSYHTFKKLCELEESLELSSYCPPDCDGQGCHSFSYVNYITYMSQQQACSNVTTDNFEQTVNLLRTCYVFYKNLPGHCWFSHLSYNTHQCNMSSSCRSSSIYDLFYFILDEDTLSSSDNIVYTTTFIHLAQGKATHNLYLQLLDHIDETKSNRIKLIALDFGLKNYVFEEYLLWDTSWIALAMVIIFIILWLYTESLFLASMTLISMVFTVVISFFIYQFIFSIQYFPFLNLLAAVVVVGIGADDLFIYWKTWLAIKHSRNASILDRLVTYAIKHASAAMFVTSASTATAFYASAYTDILSVRCFCIYAGTCVLIHYLLVLTWLPACVVLYEKHALAVCCASEKSSKLCQLCAWLHTKLVTFTTFILKKLVAISTMSPLWLPLFLLVSVAGGIAVFYWPKLSSPSADMFQMLPASHPFEVYDLKVKNRFAFSRVENGITNLPLIFVFGVDSSFNGNYFDLGSSGTLKLAPLPPIFQPEVQLWFSDFCFRLRQQQFFDVEKTQPSGCFIEELRTWMRLRDCSQDFCCKDLLFPYNATVFSTCLSKWSNEIRQHYTDNPGVRFKDNRPAVIIISFWSKVKFTNNYLLMKQFFHNVSTFIQLQADGCPSKKDCSSYMPMFTTSGGLRFYDVQETLISSLPLSLIVVLASSSVIILFTTLNFLVTVCALISISCSILATLGVLAVMGWDLNILESVIVTLAVGLSMDYPLHVAVAYRIACSTQDRKSRIIVSLHHVEGSIMASMATTLVAGICMLPSHVLAYVKLGLFLIIVAVNSWLSASFLMSSLLTCIGPIGNFSQVTCRCKKKKHTVRQFDKTIYSDEMSSDVVTNAAQTQSSHVNTDADENDIELVTQTTSLINNSRAVESTCRLSPIEETPLTEV